MYAGVRRPEDADRIKANHAGDVRTVILDVAKPEDIKRVMGSLFHAGDIAKYIDLPLANYSTLPYDKVLKGGKTIGVSTYTGYTYN